MKGETKTEKKLTTVDKAKTGDYGRQKIFKIIAVPSRNTITYLTSHGDTHREQLKSSCKRATFCATLVDYFIFFRNDQHKKSRLIELLRPIDAALK